MAIFKYTVANKEGKKLSGTVEAPEEQTARIELNNLGFSILSLEETTEAPQIDSSLTKFAFEAIDKNTKLVSGTIPAKDEPEALEKLKTEYSLTVSAIWPENATPEQIIEAKTRGSQQLQQALKTAETENATATITEEAIEQQKKNQETRAKIDNALNEVSVLLKEFDGEFDPKQKNEINKKIDKILRIKNSTNLAYILDTATELLEFIQAQEKSLKEKGHEEKRLELKMETSKMLDELNSTHKKTLSEDILGKINKWQAQNTTANTSTGNKILNSLLNKIKGLFETPPAILALKEQIKAYNKQLWEFAKLYFKEPTPEYKEKVKNSLKGIWQARKKAVENLKQIKKQLKESSKEPKAEENIILSFVEEINAFTGWLLTFYVIYYFSSLYINTKDFGLSSIPKGFEIYNSHIFKYVFVILFLLHAGTSIKVNFFRKNILADIIIVPVFIFGSIIALLNF